MIRTGRAPARTRLATTVLSTSMIASGVVVGATAAPAHPVQASASSAAPASASSSPAAGAAAWRSQVLCVVRDRRIDEGSGITRSTYRRRVFFVHNDSGDSARFFAVSPRGRTRAVFRLPNAPSRDWEDVAAGPRHSLWFADIGDNAERRRAIAVIRVREPAVLRSRALRSTTFWLRYPDGAHDAEGLMVSQRTGRVLVVTKRAGGGAIYVARRPLRAGRINRLVRIGSAPENITGADFGPGGVRFVLRNYSRAYVYSRWGGRRQVVRLPSFGESITFNRWGTALLIHREGVRRAVWRVSR